MDPVLLYKCMADDTRLRILLLIQGEGELCVCELTEALALSQPKISRHLAQLREAHLLLARRQGQWVYYRLSPRLPQWCLDVLAATHAHNSEWLAANIAALEAMSDRPANEAACC